MRASVVLDVISQFLSTAYNSLIDNNLNILYMVLRCKNSLFLTKIHRFLSIISVTLPHQSGDLMR